MIAVIVAGSALYKLIISWLIGLLNTALTKSNIKAVTNIVLANIFFMRVYEIVV
jgi:hypothetical protein